MKSHFDDFGDMYIEGVNKTEVIMLKTLLNSDLSKKKISILIFVTFAFYLFPFSFLHAQDTLEEIVTWEIPGEVIFRCVNLNSDGSDLNNDGYDDFIHWYPGDPYRFQFFMGNEIPDTTYNFEIEVPFGSDAISWGGDLNDDGYKDIVYSVCTNSFDPGDVYICFGGEEIDLDPEIILQGEDYIPDPTGLNYKGFNGGYDFNGDGFDDLLTWGEGPSYNWNGLVQIFLGGEELSTTPDFQIQGNVLDEFGRFRAVGDINGDGFDDLIVSRDETMSDPVFLEVYLGGIEIDTIPDFVSDETFILGGTHKIGYAKGDINNDGFEDVIISPVGIFLGNQNCILNLDYTLSGYLEYTNINNDEYEDILYYNSGTGIINILYGSDSFDTNPDIIHNANKYFCNIGDFNNDGEDEILLNDGDHPTIVNSATLYGLSGGSSTNEEISLVKYILTNHPNPFKPSGAGRSSGTTISYDLSVTIANPVIEIFNIKGEKIRTFNCQNQMPIIWDGTDNFQNQVSSGIYLYRIKTDEGVLLSKKMLLLK